MANKRSYELDGYYSSADYRDPKKARGIYPEQQSSYRGADFYRPQLDRSRTSRSDERRSSPTAEPVSAGPRLERAKDPRAATRPKASEDGMEEVLHELIREISSETIASWKYQEAQKQTARFDAEYEICKEYKDYGTIGDNKQEELQHARDQESALRTEFTKHVSSREGFMRRFSQLFNSRDPDPVDKERTQSIELRLQELEKRQRAMNQNSEEEAKVFKKRIEELTTELSKATTELTEVKGQLKVCKEDLVSSEQSRSKQVGELHEEIQTLRTQCATFAPAERLQTLEESVAPSVARVEIMYDDFNNFRQTRSIPDADIQGCINSVASLQKDLEDHKESVASSDKGSEVLQPIVNDVAAVKTELQRVRTVIDDELAQKSEVDDLRQRVKQVDEQKSSAVDPTVFSYFQDELSKLKSQLGAEDESTNGDTIGLLEAVGKLKQSVNEQKDQIVKLEQAAVEEAKASNASKNDVIAQTVQQHVADLKREWSATKSSIDSTLKHQSKDISKLDESVNKLSGRLNANSGPQGQPTHIQISQHISRLESRIDRFLGADNLNLTSTLTSQVAGLHGSLRDVIAGQEDLRLRVNNVAQSAASSGSSATQAEHVARLHERVNALEQACRFLNDRYNNLTTQELVNQMCTVFDQRYGLQQFQAQVQNLEQQIAKINTEVNNLTVDFYRLRRATEAAQTNIPNLEPLEQKLERHAKQIHTINAMIETCKASIARHEKDMEGSALKITGLTRQVNEVEKSCKFQQSGVEAGQNIAAQLRSDLQSTKQDFTSKVTQLEKRLSTNAFSPDRLKSRPGQGGRSPDPGRTSSQRSNGSLSGTHSSKKSTGASRRGSDASQSPRAGAEASTNGRPSSSSTARQLDGPTSRNGLAPDDGNS